MLSKVYSNGGNGNFYRILLLGLMFLASVAGFLSTSTFLDLKGSVRDLQTEIQRLSQMVQRHEMLLHLSESERTKYFERERSK